MKLRIPVVSISLRTFEIGSSAPAHKEYSLYTPRKSNKNLRKKFMALIVVAVLVGGVIFISIRNLNAPAEGIVSQAPPSSADQADPTATVPGNYSGKYVSLAYPANYKPAASQLGGNYIEVADFYGTKDKSKQISVGVVRENIIDDSGIAYRRGHKELYKETSASNGAITFTGTDGHERTSYFQHGDMVVSIAVSSSNLTDLTADSQTVVNSLKWN